MKFLLFILFFVTVFFVNYSIEQSAEPATTMELTTNRPIIPAPEKTSTTPRISTAVLYAVPITIVGITLLVGFGLITYASITGGNGIFFLTRTPDERLIP
jgi:hypothetical protein